MRVTTHAKACKDNYFFRNLQTNQTLFFAFSHGTAVTIPAAPSVRRQHSMHAYSLRLWHYRKKE